MVGRRHDPAGRPPVYAAQVLLAVVQLLKPGEATVLVLGVQVRPPLTKLPADCAAVIVKVYVCVACALTPATAAWVAVMVVVPAATGVMTPVVLLTFAAAVLELA